MAAREELTRLVPLPPAAVCEAGIEPCRQITAKELLGLPRANFSAQSQNITNPSLLAWMTTESVGPFRVTGARPAVASLREILSNVQQYDQELYNNLGTAGMLCVRRVRGSRTAISNHSWGTAVDLTLCGELDCRGDVRVQAGLLVLAPFFQRAGWFWGAAFRTEDAMHFEVGDALLRQWVREGQGPARPSTHREQVDACNRALVLSRGDRGVAVRRLQQLLRFPAARCDGIFGRQTHKAVRQFQDSVGLPVDGIVGPRTMMALIHNR